MTKYMSNVADAFKQETLIKVLKYLGIINNSHNFDFRMNLLQKYLILADKHITRHKGSNPMMQKEQRCTTGRRADQFQHIPTSTHSILEV